MRIFKICSFRLAKFVEGAGLAGACERDWREHEENFSRNLSVPRQTCAEKEFGCNVTLPKVGILLSTLV